MGKIIVVSPFDSFRALSYQQDITVNSLMSTRGIHSIFDCFMGHFFEWNVHSGGGGGGGGGGGRLNFELFLQIALQEKEN